MAKGNASKEAIARAAERSVKASARLEGRALPSGHQRSVRVQAVLDSRKDRS